MKATSLPAARPAAVRPSAPRPARPILPRPVWERHKLFQEPAYAEGLGVLEDLEDDGDGE